jgi:hypothetical protein
LRFDHRLAEIRAASVRGLLIYRSDYHLQPPDRDQRRPMA